MSAHSVAWKLAEGCHPFPAFSCAAPIGAPCRLACAVRCDAWGETGDCEHPQEDQGFCGALVWLNDGECGHECYDGPPTEVRSGPVTVTWQVDYGCYGWSYAEATS